MTEKVKIRFATEEDSASILGIYAPYILNTAITFECEVPTVDEFAKRIVKVQDKYPWLVCEYNGSIAGYAYASQFKERAAYDWSVDFSIYIDPQYHGKKMGKTLYFCLYEISKLQGYCNAYASVTVPNAKSERLHEVIGFQPIGVYKKVGYKLDNWRDVKLYGMKIAEHVSLPSKPKAINEISTSEINAILQNAEQLIE